MNKLLSGHLVVIMSVELVEHVQDISVAEQCAFVHRCRSRDPGPRACPNLSVTQWRSTVQLQATPCQRTVAPAAAAATSLGWRSAESLSESPARRRPSCALTVSLSRRTRRAQASKEPSPRCSEVAVFLVTL